MAQNDSVVGGPTTVVDLAAKDRPRTALKPEMYSKWSGADKGCYVPSATPKKVTISVAEGATPVSGTWKSSQPGTTSSFSNVCSSNRGSGESVDREASKAEREKYLTARYPRKQMSFIRRRLDVEDWIDETLNSIYDVVLTTRFYCYYLTVPMQDGAMREKILCLAAICAAG